VDDAYAPAAMAAERLVLDEPKAIGSASALRTAEQRPRPAVPEPDVRQADQFPPVANLDDRVRRVELHHAGRTQPWDFHALELIEKAAMIGIGAAFGHGLRLRLACTKRKARGVRDGEESLARLRRAEHGEQEDEGEQLSLQFGEPQDGLRHALRTPPDGLQHLRVRFVHSHDEVALRASLWLCSPAFRQGCAMAA
jgi:hypothetical protein